MGSFVGYLALLITSFRVYSRNRKNIPTSFMKIAMVLCCVAGMFVGSVWGIGVLKVMAVVFLVMFLLELPIEIQPESVTGWACILLGIGAAAWLGSLWASSHMHIVGPWFAF